ncbi:MAG: ketopantoate reductase family protein [Candidatus Malihini olakiniferum]
MARLFAYRARCHSRRRRRKWGYTRGDRIAPNRCDAARRYQVKTSMGWDILKGRRTEIDEIYGLVIQHEAKLSIPVPAN